MSISRPNILPVILSGGAGSRLWPLSKQAHPKQLLPLTSSQTMLQETVSRMNGDMFLPPLFICNDAHTDKIENQMQDLDREISGLIIEPVGRNTAPCAVVAALYAQQHAPDSLILLAPADHHVTQPDAFRACIDQAISTALDGYLVTFGITPDGPETGYGYIEQGPLLADNVYKVEAFREKPDVDTARSYLERGNFSWNAGVFLFSPHALLSEMTRHAPEILSASRQAYDLARIDQSRIFLDKDSFLACPADSIDYALMERTQHAAIVPSNIGWSDIGSYSALRQNLAGEHGNAFQGPTLNHGSQNCLVHSDGPLVCTVGLSNIGVIVKDGAVLVVDLDTSQDVKKIVTQLKGDKGYKNFL